MTDGAARALVLLCGTDAGPYPLGHPFPRTAPLLCRLLLDAGMHVELSTNLDRVKNDSADGVAPFDVLVALGRFRERDESAVAAIGAYVRAGGGLAVLHIASSSFPGSTAWMHLIGPVWVYGEDYEPGTIVTSSHPPLRDVAVALERDHPITAPLSDFVVQDELYRDLHHGPANGHRVLATGWDAPSDDRQPVVLVGEAGAGRVFHCTLGHDERAYAHADFGRLVTRGIAWAGGAI